MSGQRGRLDRLEAARAAWQAEHLPLSDAMTVLRAVLQVISEEAGPGVAGRVAGRMIAAKAERVELLSQGQR